MSEYGGVVIELGGSFYGEIVAFLESAAPENSETGNVWTTTLSELVAHTGRTPTEVLLAVDWINAHVRSVDIDSKVAENSSEIVFSVTFRELEGAWVPYYGPYNNTIVKTVEKRIHVIEPVTIGGGLKQPRLYNKSRKAVKRSPTPFKEDEVVWATGTTPSKISSFIEPTFYNDMKSMVAWGRHIALEGPPGIGKSSAVAQLAAETGNILVSVPGDSGFHKRDLTGIQQIAAGKSVIMAAEYATAAVKGWWCRIDEVNAADADALMYINSQTEEPFRVQLFGRTYPVHKDFRLFITYNRGLAGTKMLPQATIDRFALFRVSYPDKDFLTRILILKGAADMREVYILSEVAQRLWSERLRYQLSPRRLFDAILLARSNPDKRIEDFIELAIVPYVWSEPEVDTVRSLISRSIGDGISRYETYTKEQADLESMVESGDVVLSQEVLT